MKPEKIIILANAASRSLSRQALQTACAVTGKHVHTEIVFTRSLEHAREATAAASADPANLVVACGGDGTIHTLLNNLSRGAALGIIPAGTANVIARELGIPADMRNACKALLTGAIQETDIGDCNGQKFLFVAGIGFDAKVAGSVSPVLKRIFGRYAYHIAGVQQFFGYRPPRLTVTIDGDMNEHHGRFAIIANMRRYGGDLFFCPAARYDDGLLDLLLVKDFRLNTMLRLLNFARGNGAFPGDGVRQFTGKSFVIKSSEPTPYQLDGEVFAPLAEFNIAIASEKARIITP